jgi:tRNA_anti-like
MFKKYKKFTITAVVLALLGFASYYYAVFGGARNLASESATFIVKSEFIIKEFSANSEEANTKYLEKAVQVSGKITAISSSAITIDSNIICEMIAIEPANKIGTNIAIKGRVVGYDDLMSELKLDQCSIVKN